MIFFCFQLSELEQRVLEAEGRAEEAEDKVSVFLQLQISNKQDRIKFIFVRINTFRNVTGKITKKCLI